MSSEDKLYPKWVALLGLVFYIAMAVSLLIVTILTGLMVLSLGFLLRVGFRKLNSDTEAE